MEDRDLKKLDIEPIRTGSSETLIDRCQQKCQKLFWQQNQQFQH